MLPDLPEGLKENLKPRSFLQRPEGKGQFIFWGAVAVGAYFLVPPLGAFVSTLVTLAENTIYLGLMVGGAALAGYVLLDNWTTISYAYRNAMRAFTNMVISRDKIGTMLTSIEKKKKKLGIIYANINKLKGAMKVAQDELSQNAREASNALKLASEAKKRKIASQVYVQAREAKRLQQFSVPLKDSISQMEVLYRTLSKYAELGETIILDMQNETKSWKRNYNAINVSHQAMEAAKAVVLRDRDRDMYDQALEMLISDYDNKFAEIERFTEMSSDMIGKMDLQNAVWDTDALKMLEEWEQKGESILLGAEKSKLVSASYDSNDVLDLDAPLNPRVEERKGADYKKLLS